MNNRRKLVIALGAGALTPPIDVFAQQQGKVYRIGVLSPEGASSYGTRLEALRAGLRDQGYVEGKNIVIESRWADGKYARLPELAGELVMLKPDVSRDLRQPSGACSQGGYYYDTNCTTSHWRCH